MAAVGVAAAVAQPDVVAAVGQQVGERPVAATEDPLGAGRGEAVLQQHRTAARISDALQFQDVAVVRRDRVSLGRIAALFNQLDLYGNRDQLNYFLYRSDVCFHPRNDRGKLNEAIGDY